MSKRNSVIGVESARTCVPVMSAPAPQMGLVIKVDNDWLDVGRPQVAMHRNCHLSSYCCCYNVKKSRKSLSWCVCALYANLITEFHMHVIACR